MSHDPELTETIGDVRMNWRFRGCAGLRIIEIAVLVATIGFSADGYARGLVSHLEIRIGEATNGSFNTSGRTTLFGVAGLDCRDSSVA